MQKRLTIGVSKLAPNYESWLRKLYDQIEILDFYTVPLAEAKIKAMQCSGILLTGGCDVHPRRYGRSVDIAYCRDIDERRDILEKELIDIALREKIPLLGICRGQQMLNVAMRGTLYPDLGSLYKGAIVHSDKAGDVYHEVAIQKDSKLFRIAGIDSGQVNSAHHQAIHRIASGFIPVAHSNDQVIEAIEASESIGHPFLLAVQWHPERMELDHPLSGKLGKAFFKASAKTGK